MKWKIPPKAKIYEAYSAIADHRYEMLDDNRLSLTSSSNNKAYEISWKIEEDLAGKTIKIASNDNASYWQGYAGYPIITALMILGEIKYNNEVLPFFKGIHWKKLNQECKNNYDKVVAKILEGIGDAGSVQAIESDVDAIFDQINTLSLEKLGGSKRPPKD